MFEAFRALRVACICLKYDHYCLLSVYAIWCLHTKEELTPLQVSVYVPGAFEICDYTIRWAAHNKQFQQPGPSVLLMVEDVSQQ